MAIGITRPVLRRNLQTMLARNRSMEVQLPRLLLCLQSVEAIRAHFVSRNATGP